MQEFVQQQVEIVRRISTETVDAFGKLNYKQLNWKPAPDKWSIAQALDHLIVTDRTYFDQFDEITEGKHKNSFYQNIRFISNIIGKRMVDDISPGNGKTYKTPAVFAPSESIIKHTIVLDFKNHQKQIRGYFERLEAYPIKDIVVTSAVSSLIIYNLYDAMRLITTHQQRHLAQAQEVFAQPKFPAPLNLPEGEA